MGEFVGAQAQDIAVDRRHPINPPVGRMLANGPVEHVQVLLDFLDEFPREGTRGFGHLEVGRHGLEGPAGDG